MLWKLQADQAYLEQSAYLCLCDTERRKHRVPWRDTPAAHVLRWRPGPAVPHPPPVPAPPCFVWTEHGFAEPAPLAMPISDFFQRLRSQQPASVCVQHLEGSVCAPRCGWGRVPSHSCGFLCCGLSPHRPPCVVSESIPNI